MGINDSKPSEETKAFLQERCNEMINEINKKMTEVMEIYKQNPTYPFDFYNLSLREADTRIQTIRDLYKRFTDEELA